MGCGGCVTGCPFGGSGAFGGSSAELGVGEHVGHADEGDLAVLTGRDGEGDDLEVLRHEVPARRAVADDRGLRLGDRQRARPTLDGLRGDRRGDLDEAGDDRTAVGGLLGDELGALSGRVLELDGAVALRERLALRLLGAGDLLAERVLGEVAGEAGVGAVLEDVGVVAQSVLGCLLYTSDAADE